MMNNLSPYHQIEYSKLKIDQFFEMRKNNNYTKF
jgi:hypothetical protein